MKVEYVQNLDDEDIRHVCANALADIFGEYSAAKEDKDTRWIRFWAREFATVSNFQRKYLGILYRQEDGMVFDIAGKVDADLGSTEGYSKMLAQLRGSEICPFCGSLLRG